jgi:hypothetical protein
MKLILFLFFALSLCISSSNPIVFYKKIGGKYYDASTDIITTRKGDFLIVGRTDSYSQDMNVNAIKLDVEGNIIWDRTYGGNETEGASAVIESKEGGFLIAGYSDSYATNANENDIWLLKINSNGERVWEKHFQTPNVIDEAQGVVETSEGDFLIVGNATALADGNADVLAMKVSNKGEILWQKKYGDVNGEQVSHVIKTAQGFLLVGSIEREKKRWDIWVLHIDNEGNTLWSQNYGGSDNEMGNSIAMLSDGSFVFAGFTYTFAEGSLDIWVVKIDQKGNKIWDKTFGGLSTDEAFDVIITKDKKILIAGYTDVYIPDKNYNNTSKDGNDIFLALLDEAGKEIWQHNFGGLGSQRAYAIIEQNGTFILAGYTDEDAEQNADHLIVKITPTIDK